MVSSFHFHNTVQGLQGLQGLQIQMSYYNSNVRLEINNLMENKVTR